MTVRAKPEGMDDDLETILLFRDPGGRYSMRQVVEILQLAQDMGLPLEKESYVEQMTIGQLDALVRSKGKCDA